MATNPTRKQTQAKEILADVLNQLSLAARLDGNPNATARLDELARAVCSISTPFHIDDITARALEKRALALGLSSGVAEMLTLLDSDVSPLKMLWLEDEAFKERVEKMLEELGDL